jgi:oxygen-independent coproporphyrinogen-3 oxidase
MFDIPLSLYIHIPWCISKCPYCDFNSYGIQQHPMLEHDYVQALITDLQQDQDLAQGRPLQSIFFGGGTPSLFSPQSIDAIINAVQKIHPFSDTIEITLEANPGTFEYQKFRDFSQAGINRISLGVQSFQEEQLKRLGRVHTVNEVFAAIEALHRIHLRAFNIDLMYALPTQTVDEALQDLEQALSCEPKHLSWYHLTLEPNTVFYRHPPQHIPEEETVIDMEEQGRALLTAQGLHRYEVSAYAQTGYASLHNLNYWEFGDYLAAGAGAHGKITDLQSGLITRYTKQKIPRNYLDPSLTRTSSTTPIASADLPLEFMMNALRLNQGVPLAYYEQRTGSALQDIEPIITKAIQDGKLTLHDGYLHTTTVGLNFLNDVVNLFA